MVVTRKTGDGLVPPPTSRTNSSQPLSRHRNHEAGPNPKSKTAPSQSSSDIKSSSKPKKKSKKQHRPPHRRGFFDHLLSLTLPFVVLYVVWTCPSDVALERPVCRSLSVYADYVLRPYILPPIRKALEHPTVQPYVEQAIRLEQSLEPSVRSVIVTTTPYAVKTKELVWDGAIVPVYRRYLVPQYNAHVHPHLLQLYLKIDPYISPVYRKASLIHSQTSLTIHRIYTAVHPYAHRAYTIVKPHAVRLYEASLPAFHRAYQFASVYSSKAYTVAKPYVRLAYFRVTQRIRRYSSKVAFFRKLYVDKHVRRIWDKVQELSGSRDTNVPMPFNDSRTETETTVPAPVAVTQTAGQPSDSSPDATTQVLVKEPIAAETMASASSIIAESAHTVANLSTAMPSAVTSSSSDTSSAEAVRISTLSSSFFASAASLSPNTEGDSSSGSSSEDDDLEDLLRDLGLSSLKDSPSEEEGSDEVPEVINSTPEEQKQTEKQTTAEKRAEITARHQKWEERLQELSTTSKKSIRKMLVRVRKGAVSALWEKSDVEPVDDDATTKEDLEKMRFIEGERVSLLLDNLAAESDKLLKGLEAYLRKEDKAVKAGGKQDLDARIKKWDTFLEKVEEKFSESVTVMRGKVHRWFVQVRDIEIRDCLAASAEVKALADKAQTNLGLDYAWLEDVTYHDWQRYHGLMRVYDRFDEQIRMIQNGTHPSPPIDPLPAALDKLQVDLNDVITGWTTRIRSINSKALHEIFVSPAEPEVSILPVDPADPPPEQEQFDAPQVIIGKSEAQIQQAVEHVGPEEHIEL